MNRLSELLRNLFEAGFSSAASAHRMDIAYKMMLIAAIITGVSTFFVVVQGAIGTLNFFTNDYLDIAMSWFVPAQAPICIAALITARIARSVLDYHLMLIYGGMFVSPPSNASGFLSRPQLPGG
ncbi:DUF5455 family protein [Aliamphritea spongicola]|uniref:DUF5455 family protein n=1 Tax=Aliamphritea spongicola TaxID=707589 RepID=UPI00196B36F4|nr:DUF5455 family protein [Aliamphritea spongicola]MBN3560537.1 DUF5455 family protein [Aliamphritea spongicola]MBN3562518.1 DUF5455 family protein [Aliamphritea spongicola]